MKIETQPQDNCTITLTVEVEEERIQSAMRAEARKLARRYPIPGYRPGKAPYDVIRRHVGEQNLYQAAVETLSQQVYEEALKQENIQPYAAGQLEDAQFKPLVLKFTVPLSPEVELGDYRTSLRLDYKPPVITEEAVNEVMERLRQHHAVVEPVNRPAARGDVISLELKAFLHEGENPSDFLFAEDNASIVLEDENETLPGMAAQLIGLSAGEAKKFDLVLPADYPTESLRNQTVHVEVVGKEVKSRTLPEWNEELARKVGNYASPEELRTTVRKEIEERAEAEAEAKYTQEVIDRLVEQAQVKYPPLLLEQMLDDLVEENNHYLRQRHLTLADYLSIRGQTEDEYRQTLRPQAEARLKRMLVLRKIVDLENIAIMPDDMDQEIEKRSEAFGAQADRARQLMSGAEFRKNLRMEMLTKEISRRLIAIAQSDLSPVPVAETETAALPANTPIPPAEAA